MEAFAITIGVFTSIAILALLKANRDTRYFLALEQHDDSMSEDTKMVSIIITARNEATSLASTIQSLSSQAYSKLEIIVVNDRSTDATSQIAHTLAAQDSNISVIDVEELPAGWLGKNHACHIGQKNAQGEWILFCDADIQFSGNALTRAINYAQMNGLDHLTILPKYKAPNLLLSVLSAAAVNILLSGTRAADIALLNRNPNAKDRSRGRVLGIGAFNLVRTEAWRKSEGFEKIKAEVLDDMGVALLIKQVQGRTDWLWSKSAISLTWYPSLLAMFTGLKKSFWAGAGYRPLRLIFQAIGLLGLAVSPWVSFFLQDYRVSLTLGTIAAGMLLRVAYRRSRLGYQPFIYTLLAPFGQIGLSLMMLISAFQGLFSPQLNWRETTYSFEMLRDAQVVWKKRR